MFATYFCVSVCVLCRYAPYFGDDDTLGVDMTGQSMDHSIYHHSERLSCDFVNIFNINFSANFWEIQTSHFTDIFYRLLPYCVVLSHIKPCHVLLRYVI